MPKCPRCGSDPFMIPLSCTRLECLKCGYQEDPIAKIEELERQVGEARDLFNDFFDDETSVTTAPLMLGMKRWLADTEPKEGER